MRKHSTLSFCGSTSLSCGSGFGFSMLMPIRILSFLQQGEIFTWRREVFLKQCKVMYYVTYVWASEGLHSPIKQIITLERLSQKERERAYSTWGANCSQRKSRQTGIMSSVMTLNWMPCLSNSFSSGAIWPAVSWGPAHILSLRLLFLYWLLWLLSETGQKREIKVLFPRVFTSSTLYSVTVQLNWHWQTL